MDDRVKYYTDVKFTNGDNCMVVIEENIFILGNYLGLRIKGQGICMTLKNKDTHTHNRDRERK